MLTMKRLSSILIFVVLSVAVCMAQADEGTVVVEPMLTTMWGQAGPFRQSCPFDKNGNRTPPGCGAVAVGQIVNYYRAFDHGFGHITYDYTQKGEVAGTVDVDFTQCKFDWDNLRDVYPNGQYTSEQSKAVSDLLFWIGAAMRMHYRPEGSAPSNHGCTIWGLHHFLHFSNKAVIRNRRDYSTAEWIEMLNSNLQAHHPVYYAARWRNGTQASEHIFVVDGMDDEGHYCVNFGTGNSVSNREGLDINVLNQWGNGVMGGRGVCWNIGASMMTDMYPASDDEYMDDGLIVCRPIVLNGDPDRQEIEVALGESFSLGTRFQHYGIENSNIEYRLCLADRNGNVVDYIKATDGRVVILGPGYYLDLVKHFRLPTSLADGRYTLRFVTRPDGATNASWQPVYETLHAEIDVQVQAGQARITVPVNHRRSPHLILREEVRVVENVYERQQPGTSLLLAMRNSSVSAFCDTLRLHITLAGESVPFVYETEAAVYDGCDADYQILIPDTTFYLKGKQFSVKCEYKDQGVGQFLPLTCPTDEDGMEPITTHRHLCIYDLQGRCRVNLPPQSIESDYQRALSTLPNGVYVVTQYGRSRKVVVSHK